MHEPTRNSHKTLARGPSSRLARVDTVVLLGVFFLLAASLLTAYGHLVQYKLSKIAIRQLFVDMYGNISSELIGIAVTILIIDTLNRLRDARFLRTQLVRQIRNKDNTAALHALEELSSNGWLDTDLLKGAYLVGANLTGTDLLRQLNLQNVRFQGAVLEDVNLFKADMRKAVLTDARLRGADMPLANLEGAHLVRADLRGVMLRGAILRQTVLVDAALQGADLGKAEFDVATILPDGARWTQGTDLGRFTNRDHPDFWYSSNPRSPAHLPASTT